MIIINPGSGDVTDEQGGAVTEANARIALDLFVAELLEGGHEACLASGLQDRSGDGRWTATVTVDGAPHEVDMPGCDPAVTSAGTPWVSPRLYVDGSSWLWGFALSVIVPDTTGDDE